jgi:hypothetical protein
MQRSKQSGHTPTFNGEILLSGEFYGAIDSWTEFLCLERHLDGTITLSSRGHQILGETMPYSDEDGNLSLPPILNGQVVGGHEGDYVIGTELVPHGQGAEVTISVEQIEFAVRWLEDRGWNRMPGCGAAWCRIQAALGIVDRSN